tara:strand:+ start:187 stop:966 length:780 start_codon:yes stop_codon:yes gene_type:complete
MFSHKALQHASERTEKTSKNRNNFPEPYNWKTLVKKIESQAKIDAENATEYSENNTKCNKHWIKTTYYPNDWLEGINHNTIHTYLKNREEILAFITFGPFSKSQNDAIHNLLDEKSFEKCKTISYSNKQIAYKCGNLFVSQLNNFSGINLNNTFSKYEIPENNLLNWSKNPAFSLLSKPDHFSYSSKRGFCVGYGCRYSILVIYSSIFVLNDFMKMINPKSPRKTAKIKEELDAQWPGFEFMEDAKKVYIPRVQCFDDL